MGACKRRFSHSLSTASGMWVGELGERFHARAVQGRGHVAPPDGGCSGAESAWVGKVGKQLKVRAVQDEGHNDGCS